MEFWCFFHRSGARAENRSRPGRGGYRQLQAAEHDNLSATRILACEAPHRPWLILGPDARVAARNAWSLTAHQESLMRGEQRPGRVPVRKNCLRHHSAFQVGAVGAGVGLGGGFSCSVTPPWLPGRSWYALRVGLRWGSGDPASPAADALPGPLRSRGGSADSRRNRCPRQGQ